MLSALRATPLLVTVLKSRIIPHHEVSVVKVGHIIIDVGVVHVSNKIIEAYIEKTIISLLRDITLMPSSTGP